MSQFLISDNLETPVCNIDHFRWRIRYTFNRIAKWRIIKDLKNSIYQDDDETVPLNRFILIFSSVYINVLKCLYWYSQMFILMFSSVLIHNFLLRRLRKAAYHSTSFFLRGKLGRGRRIVVPACIKSKIRELCPNQPDLQYMGHKWQ